MKGVFIDRTALMQIQKTPETDRLHIREHYHTYILSKQIKIHHLHAHKYVIECAINFFD